MKVPYLTLLLLLAAGSVAGQEVAAENVALAGLGLDHADGTQALAPFAELERRVVLGDEIFVTDREGRQARGRLTRLSLAAMVVLVGGQERTVEPAALGRIEKRDPLWNGALIGAVPFTLIGIGAAGAGCSPHCARYVSGAAVFFAGIGAGVGALIDRHIRGYAAVYGPGLAPPNAIRQAVPVTSLGELWTRVRQGDTVRVLARSGDEVTGTFERASPASIFVLEAGQLREFQASEVRRVARRGNQYRRGALLAAALGGLAGALGCGGSRCSPGVRLGAALGTGGGLALWGALIGSAVSKHAVVFESGTPAAARINPHSRP